MPYIREQFSGTRDRINKFFNFRSDHRSQITDHGFTLIELLIVLAIIAVMVTIGFASFTTVQKRSRDTQRKSNLKAVQGALEQYYADFNHYPTPGTAVDIGTIKDANCGSPLNSVIAWGTGNFTCGGKTYMRQLPKEPQGSTYQYRYVVCNSNQSYALFSKLENGTATSTLPSGCANPDSTNYKWWVTSQD